MKKQNVFGRFFLQVLRHPFISAFVIGVIVWLSTSLFAIVKYGIKSEEADRIGTFGLLWALIAFVVLATFYGILQIKLITYIGENDKGLFLIKISSEGKVVDFGQTLWGKEMIYKIEGPVSLDYDDNCKECGFYTSTKIVSKHHNSETVIPVSINIFTNGDYDPQELYDKMVVGMGIQNIDGFTQKIILAAAEAEKETIDQAAKEFAEKKISAAQLLERVIEVLEFPKRALKNFKDVKVCIQNPSARACKGTTCEQV